MDAFDYFLNFSSEITLGILAVVMLLINVVSFGIVGFHKQRISDQSLAAKFLNLHSKLNTKLYVHNNAVKTTVLANNNFAPIAYAADNTMQANVNGSEEQVQEEDAEFESVITKPPIEAKDLLARQITVYQSQKGDTLASIAKKYGITKNTLAWSNNISPDTAIKPGWFFLISPEKDTIIHKTTKKDSIPGLAKTYGVDEDVIIGKNGLEDAGDIEPGVYLYIPNGRVKEEVKPIKKNGKPSGPVISSVGNPFPKGQCTWYVASQTKVYWRGNAKDWPRNAAAAGATVNKVVGVGKIAVTPDSYYGHVSMVRAVYDNGTVLLEDYNYSGRRQHGTHIEKISRVQAFITP